MAIKASEISDLIKARIEKFASASEERNIGTVVTVTDGIVRILLGDKVIDGSARAQLAALETALKA